MNQAPQVSQPQSAQPSELKQAFEKSKATIAAEYEAKTSPKRGRGRPKKIKIEASDSVQTPQSSSPSMAPTMDMVPFLKIGIAVPFNIASDKTGCEQIRVTDQEQNDLATVVNGALNSYVPDLATQDPKKIALISVAFSFGMVCLTKYSAYQMWLKENAVKSEPKKDAPEPVKSQDMSSEVPDFRRPIFANA